MKANSAEEDDSDLQRALQESAKDSGNLMKVGLEQTNQNKVKPIISEVQVSGSDEDEELQKALRLSLQHEDSSSDNELKRALQMSLECKFTFIFYSSCKSISDSAFVFFMLYIVSITQDYLLNSKDLSWVNGQKFWVHHVRK